MKNLYIATVHDVDWSLSPLLQNPPGASFYLIKSFQFVSDNQRQFLSTCSYGDRRITRALRKANALGIQFQPEESSSAGLAMLGLFLSLWPRKSVVCG